MIFFSEKGTLVQVLLVVLESNFYNFHKAYVPVCPRSIYFKLCQTFGHKCIFLHHFAFSSFLVKVFHKGPKNVGTFIPYKG